MAARRLSDSDKSELVELYREPGQTTSTLAKQFGVSNSTVSRILKSLIPAEEYSELISQKRMAGGDKSGSTRRRSRKSVAASNEANVSREKDSAEEDGTEEAKPAREKPAPPKLKTAAEKSGADTSGRRRRRRRKSDDEDEQLPLLVEDSLEEDDTDDEDGLDEGLEEVLGEDFGDDDDELDEEDDDLEDDGDEDVLLPTTAMEIMPLGEAVLPKPCYVVVDTRAELITRPLSEFADLGEVSDDEGKARTLPIFDNHRVARRFSRHKQRVIKVPDGNLITRTSPYLQAKGITRLLVDGQVYGIEV